MKQAILSLTFLFFSAAGFSQSKDSVIQIRHGFFGNKYYMHGVKLSMPELTETLKSNEKAYKHIQSARTYNSLYYLLGIPGPFLFTYGLFPGNLYADPKWGFVAAGTAMTITSFVFYYKSKNQAQTGIDLYNSGLQRTSFHKREVRFGIQGNGFAARVNF